MYGACTARGKCTAEHVYSIKDKMWSAFAQAVTPHVFKKEWKAIRTILKGLFKPMVIGTIIRGMGVAPRVGRLEALVPSFVPPYLWPQTRCHATCHCPLIRPAAPAWSAPAVPIEILVSASGSLAATRPSSPLLRLFAAPCSPLSSQSPETACPCTTGPDPQDLHQTLRGPPTESAALVRCYRLTPATAGT